MNDSSKVTQKSEPSVFSAPAISMSIGCVIVIGLNTMCP